MINEGYGDPGLISGLEVEDFLLGADGWVRRAAYRICHPARMDRLDDVRQEGRIALWRAYDALADEPERVAYSMQRAKRRMEAFASERRLQTGHTHGLQGQSAEVPQITILDQPVGDGADTIGSLLRAADLMGDIEMAYHHGEIVAVINTLAPEHREYVHRRFWEGWNDSEIARHLGVSTSGMHNRWVRTIKPQIQQRLAHLVDAA